ncbi:MAG: ABC transporter ATP-binding protein [Spirochaetales bacterium]|nr:ABC transporter ATP-binding protein [Spirochaetales bacterium]
MIALFRLFRFLKQYTLQVVIALILLVFAQILMLVQPKIIEFVIDTGVKNKDLTSTLLGAGSIFLAAVISFFFQSGSGFLRIKATQGMEYKLRNALYKKIMSFCFPSLDKWRTGELIVRSTSDVTTIKTFTQMGIFLVVQALIMLSGSLVFMFLTNSGLAFIMAIIIPVVFFLFAIMAGFIRPLFLAVREKLDKLNNVLQENLAGAKVVRAYARQENEIEKFINHNESFLKNSLKVGYLLSVAFPFLFFIGQIILTITLWAGGSMVIENLLNPGGMGLTLGQLIAFMNYASMAIFPIMMLGMVLGFISMASASATRIEELFQVKPSITEKENALETYSFKGKIEFKDVSFHYGNGENVISHINLLIQPGEKIGILGTTGSGKSTLVHLIPRFFDPTEGHILIDDMKSTDISFQSLRTRISIIFQEIVLFSGSIKENILFGNPSASSNEMIHAAGIACADTFINNKENVWDEHIGERGAGLSGGERQRIAIARTVISNPDIIILDDVTSSVDIDTEKQLITNLFKTFSEKTVIIISQKITTVQNADRIFVLDKGEIKGTGSHDELLASNKMYQEIFETQNAQLYT